MQLKKSTFIRIHHRTFFFFSRRPFISWAYIFATQGLVFQFRDITVFICYCILQCCMELRAPLCQASVLQLSCIPSLPVSMEQSTLLNILSLSHVLISKLYKLQEEKVSLNHITESDSWRWAACEHRPKTSKVIIYVRLVQGIRQSKEKANFENCHHNVKMLSCGILVS